METSAARMNEIGSEYETECFLFNHSGAAQPEIVLEFDPQRFYVRFDVNPNVGGNAYVVPVPIPAGFLAGGVSNLPLECKWRDAPSVCSGEWVAFANAPATVVVITCRYLR